MKNILFLLACVCLLPGIAGFSELDIETWGNVYLVREMNVPISIENTSLQDKELEVAFIGPSGVVHEFSDLPGEIKGSETAKLNLFMAPTFDVEGTTYEATLLVKLGGDTIAKKMSIHTSKFIPEPQPTEEENGGEENNIIAPFVLLGASQNTLTVLLALIVVLLALILIAKFWSVTKNDKRRGYYE